MIFSEFRDIICNFLFIQILGYLILIKRGVIPPYLNTKRITEEIMQEENSQSLKTII